MASDATDPPPSEPEVVQVPEEKPAEDLAGPFSPFCRVCNNELSSREPKLMPCLHTVCKQCVDNLTNQENKTARCPICRQECRNLDDIIDNHFIVGTATPASTDSSAPNTDNVCTNCDDNATISAWCQDCEEWLCDACVQAHHRVKLTKDHTIRPKDEMEDPSTEGGRKSSSSGDKRTFFCDVHKQEQLKLYCESCDKLTCRDCQLLEHKDHKYQFISEAATRQKAAMKVLLNKLQEKHTYVCQTRKHIRDKKHELVKNEQKVTQEIKTLVYRLVTEINNRGKRLITELSTACEGRRKIFDQQMQEIERLERTIQHCYKFTEQAATADNDSAILYSRKLIVQQMVLLLRTMCTRQPVAGLDIRFLRNEQNMMNLVGRLGMLVIRDPLNKTTPSQQAAAAAAAAVAASQGRAPQGASTAAQMQMHKEAMLKEQQQRINLHQLMLRRQGSNSSSESGSVQMTNGGHMYIQPGQSPHSNGPQSRHMNGPSAAQLHHINNGPQTGQRFAINRSPPYSSANTGMIQLSGSPPNQTVVRPSSHPTMMPLVTHQMNQRMQGPRSNSVPQMMLQRTTGGDIILSGSSTPSSPPIISPPLPTDNSSVFQPGYHGAMRIKEEPKSSHETNERPSCSLVDSAMSTEATAFIPTLDFDSQRTTGSVHSEPQLRPTSIPTSDGAGSSKSEGAEKSNNSSALIKQEPGPLPVQISCVFGGTNGINESGGKGEHQMALYNTYEPVNQDPNEDWCACCHNGGELLCCDSCPRVYHLSCHIPALTSTPTDSDSWVCSMCKEIDEELPDDRKRRNSAAISIRDRMICEKIALELFCFDQSVPFHKPVSKAHVPDYYKVVSQPMQLSTIKSKLQPAHFNHYQSIDEFIADVRLMLNNCYLYNGELSEMGKIGKAVEAFFSKLLDKYVPGHIHVSSSVAVGSGDVSSANATGAASQGILLSDSEASTAEGNTDERPPKRKRKPEPEDIVHYTGQ